ncbi:MAG: hypothetical protein FD180_668 [Planctomycetota bacterium]|nr:MAG: hypothetical protein FD180_668 [Planctomycetota bacterium]
MGLIPLRKRLPALRLSPALSAILAAVLALPAVTGCKKSGDSDDPATSYDFTEFPGAPVADGDVAGDSKGFSPPGMDVIPGSIRCTPNGDRGTMIVTYGAISGAPPVASLFAQYYDGDSWTPPVTLNAIDASNEPGSVTYTSIVHAWVNTSSHASETASDRDGDCIIFWRANDADDDGEVVLDGVNRNLFATYFNRRLSTDLSSRFGFQEFASRLSVEDEAGEDVRSFGIATDGLCGEARWDEGQAAYRFGEQTTGLVVFWNQRENNDGVAGFDDRALHACRVTLDFPLGSDLPLESGFGIGPAERLVIDAMGGSDTGSSSEETQVDAAFLSYNNLLVFRVVADNRTESDDLAGHVFDGAASTYNGPSAAGEDASLEYVTFDMSGGDFTAADVLHAVTPFSSPSDALRNDADFLTPAPGNAGGSTAFGPDEGLACVILFSAESDDDPDDIKDDPADAGGLAISEIDPASGTLLSHVVLSEADPVISDFVNSTQASARISRNGDYIMLAWLQRNATGSIADVSLMTAQYFTTRPDSDGLFVIPGLSETLSSPLAVNADSDGFDVANFAWQEGLSYICGAQSDPDVMNLAYSHPDGAGDRLFAGRVEADLLTPVAPIAGSVILASGDTPVWSLAPAVNDAGHNYRIIDSGEGGNLFAVYNVDADAGSGTDFRVHAQRTGLAAGSGPIDSNVDFREAGLQAFTLAGTPAGENTGLFDAVSGDDSPDRPHGYTRIHVFFREQKSTESSGAGFALRTRAFDTSDSGLAFGDSFTPRAGTPFEAPFDLDLPLIDPGISDDATTRGMTVDDEAVGVFFTETGHLWYQEFHPDGNEIGWINDAGASTPLLVDSDVPSESESDKPISSFELFVTRTATCSTLHGATVFYTKTDDAPFLDERLRVRSRE